MNYVATTKFDIANGPGIRTVLWVSGCSHYCKGCHNPQTWDPEAGNIFNEEALNDILESLKPEYVTGFTLSGGDPLYEENRKEVANIVKRIRQEYPDISIWLYTGYNWEYLVKLASISLVMSDILDNIDVLIDGEFELENRDLSLPYCGSTNQRVIDVQESLKEGKINYYER